MKTLYDFKNGLLKRRELIVNLKSESNPGMQGAIKAIAAGFKSEEDKVAVKKIDSQFGSDNFIITAFIYDSVESKTRIEPKIKQKKEKK